MEQANSIPAAIVTALGELGLNVAAESMIRTILVRQRFFVGHKYRFDGGYAVWLADQNVIEIYGEDETLRKTILMQGDRRVA